MTLPTWPFTPAEKRAIRDAYEALTRVGNATAEPGATDDRSDDGWVGILDRAHHDLGLVILTIESRGPRGNAHCKASPPLRCSDA